MGGLFLCRLLGRFDRLFGLLFGRFNGLRGGFVRLFVRHGGLSSLRLGERLFSGPKVGLCRRLFLYGLLDGRLGKLFFGRLCLFGGVRLF